MGSALLLSVVNYAGAAYLTYVGIQIWRGAREAVELRPGSVPTTRGVGALLRGGFTVGLGNLKGILSFAVFVPQFIDPGPPYVSQASVLVALFVLTGMLVDTGFALLASKAGDAISSPTLQVCVSSAAGLIIIGVGVATLFSKLPQALTTAGSFGSCSGVLWKSWGNAISTSFVTSLCQT